MIKKGITGIAMALALAAWTLGQRTTFTGTAVIYGSGFNTRTISRSFTMTINGQTPPDQLARFIGVLQESGQDRLADEIDNVELGRFAMTGSVGLPINLVLIDKDGGDTRVRAVFKRWIGFGELRRGRRSTDYPFSYVEIRVNPRTGRGEGTFIPVAKIRFRGTDTIEVEDFGTFPGRLMGIQMRGARR